MLAENNTKKPGQRRTSPAYALCLSVSLFQVISFRQEHKKLGEALTDKTNNIMPQAHFSLPLSNAA
jgi:hypothetical protein